MLSLVLPYHISTVIIAAVVAMKCERRTYKLWAIKDQSIITATSNSTLSFFYHCILGFRGCPWIGAAHGNQLLKCLNQKTGFRSPNNITTIDSVHILFSFFLFLFPFCWWLVLGYNSSLPQLAQELGLKVFVVVVVIVVADHQGFVFAK